MSIIFFSESASYCIWKKGSCCIYSSLQYFWSFFMRRRQWYVLLVFSIISKAQEHQSDVIQWPDAPTDFYLLRTRADIHEDQDCHHADNLGEREGDKIQFIIGIVVYYWELATRHIESQKLGFSLYKLIYPIFRQVKYSKIKYYTRQSMTEKTRYVHVCKYLAPANSTRHVVYVTRVSDIIYSQMTLFKSFVNIGESRMAFQNAINIHIKFWLSASVTTTIITSNFLKNKSSLKT